MMTRAEASFFNIEVLFHSEGTSCIRPQNGYPSQLHHPTTISKSAFWTTMESSTRSCSPVTGMAANGSTLQTASISTSNRRIGGNGLSLARSQTKAAVAQPWRTRADDHGLPGQGPRQLRQIKVGNKVRFEAEQASSDYTDTKMQK